MILVNLILILLVGGVIAWLAERQHPGLPRWIALIVIWAVHCSKISDVSTNFTTHE